MLKISVFILEILTRLQCKFYLEIDASFAVKNSELFALQSARFCYRIRNNMVHHKCHNMHYMRIKCTFVAKTHVLLQFDVILMTYLRRCSQFVLLPI